MKKIVYFLLIALCLPIGLMAQSVDDDLYFVPSKDKKEKKETTPEKKEPKRQVTTNIYTSPGTTVVVQDRKGKTRDVDEYNRRYDARENEFVMDNDTLYIKEKSNPDLDGEWVTGEFNGTTDDYEYAEPYHSFPQSAFCYQYQQSVVLGCSLRSELMGLERIYRWYVCLCIPDVQ